MSIGISEGGIGVIEGMIRFSLRIEFEVFMIVVNSATMRALALLICCATIQGQTAADQAAIWKSRGLTAASSGDIQGAVENFEKACQIFPNDEDVCYLFARALFTLGYYRKAGAALEIAIKLASKKTREKTERAMALNFVALDQPEEAERHFLKAVRAHPNSDRQGADSRVDYGAFLTRQGRAQEAAPLLERVLKDSPEPPRASAELGRALLHLGRTAEAAVRLEKAVRLDPNSAEHRLLLGKAYLQLGRVAEGERELRLGQEGWLRKTMAPQR